MSKPVPRSRLNITYRTRIEGEPKKVKLPMRFLVLGKLTTDNPELLSERPMHSVLPGMNLSSFMQEMKVTSPLPDDLSVTLIGQLEGSVTGVFKKPPEDDATEGTVVLSGGGEASGRAKDNGLGDFWGEVSLEGEHDFPLDSGQIKLPDDGTTAKISVKGAVEPPGDFDAGVTGSIDTSIEVKFEANALSPEDEVAKLDFRGAIKAEVSVSLTIPLRGIANFRPDHLSSRVPEIRRLVLLRRLVLELRSYISSNPLLGVAIRDELLKAKDELEALQEAAGPVAEGEEAPRLSDGTNLAKLKAALVEQHPQLLINPTAIAATPAVTEPEPEPAPPPAE